MEITYDPRYNVAYIKLRKKVAKNVETLKISDEVNIDITPDGKIYGIELLNANEQLPMLKEKRLLIKDESTGKCVKIAISY